MNKSDTENELWKQLVFMIKEKCNKEKIRAMHIADEIGVSPSTVTRILEMKFCPKSDILFNMANAVGIKIEFKNE